LVEAATELFSTRGPSRVTVREIAERAGVNHGLVHHYFGSKQALLGVVLDHLAQATAEEIATWDGGDRLFEPGGANDRHARIAAHLLLDAQDPAAMQTAFPALGAVVDHLRSGGLADHEARERAALVSALVLGWQLFEPFLRTAAGLGDREQTPGASLARAVHQLMNAPLVSG
jgi:AcrR family transcriptional regulator